MNKKELIEENKILRMALEEMAADFYERTGDMPIIAMYISGIKSELEREVKNEKK